MLMGIVKKNGIMIVDFAQQRVERGVKDDQAIHDASMERFRPIMMTTMAALLGALPIALGYGADGASRRPLGLVVIGGLDRFAIHHALHHAGDLPLSRRIPGKGSRSRAVLPAEALAGAGGRKRRAGTLGRGLNMIQMNRNHSLFFFALLPGLVAVVAGCAVGPNYRRPLVDVPSAYRRLPRMGPERPVRVRQRPEKRTRP